MQFEIERKSLGQRGDIKLCPEAVRKPGMVFHNFWTIEIKSLEELVTLSLKYGPIVLDAEEPAVITIEDTYD